MYTGPYDVNADYVTGEIVVYANQIVQSKQI